MLSHFFAEIFEGSIEGAPELTFKSCSDRQGDSNAGTITRLRADIKSATTDLSPLLHTFQTKAAETFPPAEDFARIKAASIVLYL